MSVSEGEREVQQQQQHLKVDYSKPYAKRRPDEPRSHYAQRLKFINELIRGMGESNKGGAGACVEENRIFRSVAHPRSVWLTEGMGQFFVLRIWSGTCLAFEWRVSCLARSQCRFMLTLCKISLSDDRIDVLSNCYTNVKFLNNKYHPDIMEILEKYDPDVGSVINSRHSIAHWKTPTADHGQQQQQQQAH
ncbi:hypothetical protein FOZ63_012029 [Perkinsus olseni]|uniref:Uncharacterized protein n=1 Tax=Perkinsus olseni TaxID=32597 RepID=A0A7J6SEB7_PEROL|nr:hypothetical protein FOZ63_012029 [Perkinsus olseni]